MLKRSALFAIDLAVSPPPLLALIGGPPIRVLVLMRFLAEDDPNVTN